MTFSLSRPALGVFCGSAVGADPAHAELARALGRAAAEAGVPIVYGGGKVGLMGVLAEAALAAGGVVAGVIPRALMELEVAAGNLSHLEVVETMHDRKRRLYEMSDVFCVLPGGFGTLDETVEILTWRHLGWHDKPIRLLDPDGHWRKLEELFAHLVGSGFARPASLQGIATVRTPAEVLAALPAPVG
ncbi:TIGR00730 family Rossman fold protein [Roseospirillum parvum]|uniref:Cytokinin riboside 5'-monophosphate phosphoribohydrolase n=1 Tax=Roseospirillum parvum TaxID=83401 RepID=A0A1G7WTE1_9PROT|nr:TIGR00730 family Rossman fold protein [Roseospirillum parvum]SDG75179.1 hypothetical protein SAMN05421742_102313 [Roseospirillum parvum]